MGFKIFQAKINLPFNYFSVNFLSPFLLHALNKYLENYIHLKLSL